MKDPEDRDIARRLYEQKKPRLGTCGPTLVAFLLNKIVINIILNWSIPYRGYCSFRELERELNKYDIKTERIEWRIKREYVLPEGVNFAIALIRWKKAHWKIQEKNTHFIYLEREDDKIELFDNEVGWFSPEDKVAKDYLKHGRFTNLIVLKGN